MQDMAFAVKSVDILDLDERLPRRVHWGSVAHVLRYTSSTLGFCWISAVSPQQDLA